MLVPILILAWAFWLANATALLLHKRLNEGRIDDWTRFAFICSTFAVVLVTVVDLGLIQG